MHPGPYGEWGSRKYLLGSLDASLERMGVDYVDIFYSHRFDPETPLEETMGALASAVQQGKALYVGVSSYTAEQTAEAARILTEMGVRPLIHQPSYSMINRWTEEDGLLDVLEDSRHGLHLLRAARAGAADGQVPQGHPRGLAGRPGQVAGPGPALGRRRAQAQRPERHRHGRGQSLAQLALNWVLRDGRMTSALIGASSVAQLEENVAALAGPPLSPQELEEIDSYAVSTPGTNIWAQRG